MALLYCNRLQVISPASEVFFCFQTESHVASLAIISHLSLPNAGTIGMCHAMPGLGQAGVEFKALCILSKHSIELHLQPSYTKFLKMSFSMWFAVLQ